MDDGCSCALWVLVIIFCVVVGILAGTGII